MEERRRQSATLRSTVLGKCHRSDKMYAEFGIHNCARVGNRLPEKVMRRALIFVAFVLLMFTIPGTASSAQQKNSAVWQAPDSAKQVKNPVKVTKENLDAAAKLFRENCMTCHGETGAGDGPAAESLMRPPANFTDEKLMTKATDGELFWKISTGRTPMPSWQ